MDDSRSASSGSSTLTQDRRRAWFNLDLSGATDAGDGLDVSQINSVEFRIESAAASVAIYVQLYSPIIAYDDGENSDAFTLEPLSLWPVAYPDEADVLHKFDPLDCDTGTALSKTYGIVLLELKAEMLDESTGEIVDFDWHDAIDYSFLELSSAGEPDEYGWFVNMTQSSLVISTTKNEDGDVEFKPLAITLAGASDASSGGLDVDNLNYIRWHARLKSSETDYLQLNMRSISVEWPDSLDSEWTHTVLWHGDPGYDGDSEDSNVESLTGPCYVGNDFYYANSKTSGYTQQELEELEADPLNGPVIDAGYGEIQLPPLMLAHVDRNALDYDPPSGASQGSFEYYVDEELVGTYSYWELEGQGTSGLNGRHRGGGDWYVWYPENRSWNAETSIWEPEPGDFGTSYEPPLSGKPLRENAHLTIGYYDVDGIKKDESINESEWNDLHQEYWIFTW